jgi:hypothetical protein
MLCPGGATAIPTCEFSSTGKPPPDYCGLRCKNGEKCPTGTTCEMPTGICAYPYPMGEPEADDLEARALDEQLITAYSALEPQPEAPPLIGGQAPWRYQYVPTKLQMPTGSNPPYSHGLEVDEDGSIYLTYFDSADSGRCLLRWSPKDSYTKFEVLGHGSEMCASGDHSNGPHGLRIAKEVRYALTLLHDTAQESRKHPSLCVRCVGSRPMGRFSTTQTTIKRSSRPRSKARCCGVCAYDAVYTTCRHKDIYVAVCTHRYNPTSTNPGPKTNSTKCVHGKYCPTWFGAQPGSEYVYMTDGYGNDEIHM